MAKGDIATSPTTFRTIGEILLEVFPFGTWGDGSGVAAKKLSSAELSWEVPPNYAANGWRGSLLPECAHDDLAQAFARHRRAERERCAASCDDLAATIVRSGQWDTAQRVALKEVARLMRREVET